MGVGAVSRPTNPKLPCPECDGLRSADAPRCRACYLRKVSEHRLCPQCKVRQRSRGNVKLCQPCHFQKIGAHLICSGCGGRKTQGRAQRCANCLSAARRDGEEAAGWILIRFDRRAFRVLLEREGWTVHDLARVSQLAIVTLNQWLSGIRRPRLTEWRMVAEALALDPCGHCGGSGVVDATEARVEAITAAVQRPKLSVLPDPEPPISGDGWILDRNRLVLTIDTTAVRITQQETALVALVASASGRFVTAPQLGTVLKLTDQGIRTHMARLRGKCAAAGADLSNVVQNVHGAGYRAVMAERAEAAS